MPDAPKGLAAALAEAQAQIPAVAKDATNPHFRSKYATLGALTEAVRPILAEHGLAWVVSAEPDNGHTLFVGTLYHTSGESIRVSLPMRLAKDDAQGMGSGVTYARRYLLGMVTGAATEDDDDGNAAAKAAAKAAPEPKKNAPPTYGAQPPSFNAEPLAQWAHVPSEAFEEIRDAWHGKGRITPAQQKRLFAIANGNGWGTDGVRAVLVRHFGLQSTGEIPNGAPYDKLVRIFGDFKSGEAVEEGESDLPI